MKKVCMITQFSFSPPHSRTWDKAKILTENGNSITFIGVDEKKTLPSKEKLEYGDVLRVHSGGIYGISVPILDNPCARAQKKIFLVTINNVEVS